MREAITLVRPSSRKVADLHMDKYSIFTSLHNSMPQPPAPALVQGPGTSTNCGFGDNKTSPDKIGGSCNHNQMLQP